MILDYAILALLGLVILLQLALWGVQRTGFRQVRDHAARLAALEERISSGSQSGTAVPNPSVPARQPAADPLQQAITLARAGRSSQEIAAACGISEAEAELLVRMRGAPM